jgi:pyroglutamyl-peptidase
MSPAEDNIEKSAATREGNGVDASEEESKDDDDFSILVTGFGPFQNIPVNPTTILVNELPDYLLTKNDSSSSSSWKQNLASLVKDWIVMDTSVQDVCKTLDALFTRTTTTTTTTTTSPKTISSTKTKTKKPPSLILHLGVHYKAEGFHLEQCAYNDASFRIPDQCGYHPNEETIIKSEQLGQALTTTLNVSELVDHQLGRFPTVQSKISTDPGRFVCNYTYCYSMHHDVRRPCLFLHVPKFEVVSKEVQLEYVACLLQKMVEQVHVDAQNNIQ